MQRLIKMEHRNCSNAINFDERFALNIELITVIVIIMTLLNIAFGHSNWCQVPVYFLYLLYKSYFP